MIFFQLPSKRQRSSVGHLVHQSPETVVVTHLDRMAQLVQQDIIDQMPRKEHQRQGEVNIFPAGTTAPMTLAVIDLHLIETKTITPRKSGKPARQEPLGLMAQGPLDH